MSDENDFDHDPLFQEVMRRIEEDFRAMAIHVGKRIAALQEQYRRGLRIQAMLNKRLPNTYEVWRRDKR